MHLQLQFRVSSLAKILGTVTMLIGLGVGAMAGGMSLQKNVILTAERMSGYDITIHDPEAEDYKAMEKMKIVDKKQYKYKVNNEAVYYLKEELLENPPLLFGKRQHILLNNFHLRAIGCLRGRKLIHLVLRYH